MPRHLAASSSCSAIKSELVRASSGAVRPITAAPRRERSSDLVRREFTIPRELDDYFSYDLLRTVEKEAGRRVSRSELLRAILQHYRDSQQNSLPAITQQVGCD